MDSPSAAGSPRRRKVRKGTRSCWECKRRKIKCIFASDSDSICVCCQRRRLPCVGQELPEELAPARPSDRHLRDRIARVESFMKDYLAKNDGAAHPLDFEPNPSLSSSRIPLTPAESIGGLLSSTSFSSPNPQDLFDDSDSLRTARQHLLASYPSIDDAQILLQESQKPELYTILVNTQPHARLTLEALSAPCALGALPDPDIHPVLLAKQLLIFAITLQSPCGDDITNLSESPDVLMTRLLTAARTWVTNEEEMHGTLDCLVCIMLEAVFEMNRGQLRRAWSDFRRALTVAQLMGLHRSPVPPQRRLDTEADYDPAFLWFRIVYMDRCLSLLLGLPRGTYAADLATPSHGPDEPPTGRFDRRLSCIASRVLCRNERPFSPHDTSATEAIDDELLRTSRSMPASFWRAVDFHNLTPGSPETLLETIRLSSHVYYFGLLIQLHLPYMAPAIQSDTTALYAKTTCANAGREIITRFIAHRSFNPKSFCSRPVDFFALLAAMALLLAHLDVHSQGDGKHNVLAHQRLSDRAILEQAVEQMDTISHAQGDRFMTKSATLIRRLLAIEADAGQGKKYVIRGLHDNSSGESSPLKDGIQLQLPYLGAVRIVPESQSFDQNAAASQLQNEMDRLEQSAPYQDGTALNGTSDMSFANDSLDDWTFQGVDTAFFDSLMRGTSTFGSVGQDQQWTDDMLDIHHI